MHIYFNDLPISNPDVADSERLNTLAFPCFCPPRFASIMWFIFLHFKSIFAFVVLHSLSSIQGIVVVKGNSIHLLLTRAVRIFL